MNQSEEKIVIQPEEKIKIVNQSEEKIQIVNHSEEKIVNHPGQTPDLCRTVASSCNSHLSLLSLHSTPPPPPPSRHPHLSRFQMAQQCVQEGINFSTQRLPFLCCLHGWKGGISAMAKEIISLLFKGKCSMDTRISHALELMIFHNSTSRGSNTKLSGSLN